MLIAALPAAISTGKEIYNAAASLFKGGSDDVMSKVWKNITPADAWRFNAVKRDDGWHDVTTGGKLSSEESDKRVTTLIATYVGAVRAASGYWLDKNDNHALTSQEALDRWNNTYGAGATPATVLQSPPRYRSGAVPIPAPESEITQYVKQQIEQAKDSVRQSATNVAGVVAGAASGAAAGANAGAQSAIALQNAEKQKMWLIAGAAVVAIVGVIVLTRK